MNRISQHLPTEQATCELHGPYVAVVLESGDKRIVSPCPHCVASRNPISSSVEHMMEAVEISSRERYSRWVKLGFPPDMFGKTFECINFVNDAQADIVKKVTKYAENFSVALGQGATIALLGENGTGKTLMACCVAEAVLRKQYSVRYASVDDIRRTVEDAKRSFGSETEILDPYKRCNLLILDEIGLYANPYDREVVGVILSARHMFKRPSILISNMDDKTFAEYLSYRITNRLIQNNFLIRKCRWDSYRTRIKHDLMPWE